MHPKWPVAFNPEQTRRRTPLITLLLLFLLNAPLIGPTPLQAEDSEKTITIPAIPATAEEFVKLRNATAKTPEGGAAMLVVALLKFAEDPKLGETFLTIALHRSALAKSVSGYKGYRPGNSIQYHMSRMKKKPYMPRAYIGGATPENGYELPQSDLPITMRRNRFSEAREGYVKVFVVCSGAASPRPVTLKQNDRGYWKAYESSSLYLDVVPPVTDDGDDL